MRRLCVESNFILELVFSQEQSAECEQLLAAAEAGHVELVLPSYCLAEPLETLGRRHKERQRLQEGIETEVRQLRRSREYREALNDADLTTNLFARSTREDGERLERSYGRLVRAAHLEPLTATITEHAFELGRTYDLKHQDAFVLASIISHLTRRPAESAFVTKNSKDFDDPGLRGYLEENGCRLLTSFGEAVGFALHGT